MQNQLDTTKLYKENYQAHGLIETGTTLLEALTTVPPKFDRNKQYLVNRFTGIRTRGENQLILSEKFLLNYGLTDSLPRLTDIGHNRNFRIDPQEKIVVMCNLSDGTGFWRDMDKVMTKLAYFTGTVKDALDLLVNEGYTIYNAGLEGYANPNKRKFEERELNINEWYILKEKVTLESLF